MTTEEEQLMEPVSNEELVEAINNASGECKNASALFDRIVRRRIRENGFQRRIQPFDDITKDRLTPSLYSELPHVVEEMESDQPGAAIVNFDSTPDTAFFRGDKFAVYFFMVFTPEFTKNVFELMTYKSDLREITTANMLKDMHTQEDTNYINTCDLIVGSPTGVGKSGHQQNFEFYGRISRESYTDHYSLLEDWSLNNGVFLMNRRTAKEFLKWGRDELGGDKAQELAMEGLEALTEFKWGNIPHIATIKRNLVPDQVSYQFAEPNFLGRAYRLQDITTFVKKEKNILRSYAQECIGVTISNVAAVVKATHIL